MQIDNLTDIKLSKANKKTTLKLTNICLNVGMTFNKFVVLFDSDLLFSKTLFRSSFLISLGNTYYCSTVR